MTIDTATRFTVVPISLPARQDEDLLILVLLPADAVNAKPRPAPTFEQDDERLEIGMTD